MGVFEAQPLHACNKEQFALILKQSANRKEKAFAAFFSEAIANKKWAECGFGS